MKEFEKQKIIKHNQDTILGKLQSFSSESSTNRLLVKTILVPSAVSLIEKLSMHPIDTIITFQQQKQLKPLSAIRHISINYGLLGFYKGLSLPLILSAPPGIILVYGSYEGLKEVISQRSNLKKTENVLTSSILTGLMVSALTTPLEAKRVRDTFEIKIPKPENKFSYYWRGLVPNTTKMLLSTVFVLAGTDIFKNKVDQYGKSSDHPTTRILFDSKNPYTTFFGGMALGAFAQAITTPVDVVKTKMMSDYTRAPDRLTFWQHTVQAYKDKNLFTGLTTRMMRFGLHSSIMLGSMSIINKFLLENGETHNTGFRNGT